VVASSLSRRRTVGQVWGWSSMPDLVKNMQAKRESTVRNKIVHAEETSSGKRRTGLSPYRILLIIGIVFVGLTVAAWIVWKGRTGPISGQRSGPDDPNSLRLLYVRPDCGEQVYDANGQSLGKRPLGNTYDNWWKPDEMQREIVFACRIDGDNPLFPPFIRLDLNGWPARRNIAWLEVGDVNDSWITLRCRSKVPRVMLSGGMGLGPIRFPPRKEPVRTVDANIAYHAGPRGPVRATFVGPFRPGQQIRARENADIQMETIRDSASQITFVFSGPPPMNHEAPVIAYTEDGKRHFLDSGGGRTSSAQGFRWERPCRNLTLKSITHITLDETPRTLVYHGIKVSYPDLPVRTHPAFLDEIIRRLDLNVDLSTENAVRNFVQNREPLDSVSEALSILDIAQGNWLQRSIETLQRAKPEYLTATERKKLSDILASWADSGREISACNLGIWAQWPEYVDRALAILNTADMADQHHRYLARALCKYTNPSPEQLTAVTDLLLNKSIIDPHPRGELVEYIFRHSGDETEHLRRLAESDKPWIWCRIIQPSGRFRNFFSKVSGSPIIKMRMVALGINNWIDDEESFGPQAYDLLAEAITPEFVQKSISDFSRVFKAFADHTPSDRGTEVLVGYLELQLNEWDKWQIDGRGSSNYYGILKTVRQLNNWHNLNLGGLGRESDSYVSDYRYDWQEIAASALHWARTGEDQSQMPPSWRISDRDLRVIWRNLDDPEQSVIGLWAAGQDTNLPQPQTVMEAEEDFLNYIIRTGEQAAQGMDSYDFLIRAGVNKRRTTNREFNFTRSELPRRLDPGLLNSFSVLPDGTRQRHTMWQGEWEIRIEPGTAERSVLDDTNLFAAWKKLYLTDEPAVSPLERVFSLDDSDAAPEGEDPPLLR